jgi:RimJ/RimL family protein N-acetyltransferase
MKEDKVPPGFDIRYTLPTDAPHLKSWLSEPSIMKWFPMVDEREIDDAVQRWISFHRYNCSLTATIDGVPCGITTLYLQPYRKLAHQSEFGIIVGTDFRNQGIGAQLLKNLMHMAKNQFHIRLLHLQVYAENPAIRLYRRFGFRRFGYQSQWIKDGDVYVGRIFMERILE